jgi:hypothetical protein
MVLKSFSNAVLTTTVKLESNGMKERQLSEEFRFCKEKLIDCFNVQTLNFPERSEGNHKTGNVSTIVILRSVLATFVAAEKR